MVFTGPYFDDFCAKCYISMIPLNYTLEGYLCAVEESAALMEIAVRGVVEHFAVGFYKGTMAILKAEGLPGEYVSLAAKRYEYDVKRVYCFEVEVKHNVIEFSVTSIEESEISKRKTREKISYNARENLSGCVGFIGIGNGLTVYQYNIGKNRDYME